MSTDVTTPRGHAVVWFEIPARDLDAQTRFYETVFGATLHREAFMDWNMAIFPGGDTDVRGALMTGPFYTPSADGSIVFLNADGRLDDLVGRFAANGGGVIVPSITLERGMGRIAYVTDPEGNRIGLHDAIVPAA